MNMYLYFVFSEAYILWSIAPRFQQTTYMPTINRYCFLLIHTLDRTITMMWFINQDLPWFALDPIELVGAFLYVAEFKVNFRTFFSGWKTIIYILGVKRQRRATEALKLMDTHNVVVWIWNIININIQYEWNVPNFKYND